MCSHLNKMYQILVWLDINCNLWNINTLNSFNQNQYNFARATYITLVVSITTQPQMLYILTFYNFCVIMSNISQSLIYYELHWKLWEIQIKVCPFSHWDNTYIRRYQIQDLLSEWTIICYYTTFSYSYKISNKADWLICDLIMWFSYI